MKELTKIVEQGESRTLEFKGTTTQIKAAFETVCGFLNAEGGIVIIGVKQDGQIQGQHVTDNTRQEIAREIKKIEPPAQGLIEVLYTKISNDKSVISLMVPKGNQAPYTYDARPFERIQSTTTRMPQQQYDQLVAYRLKHDFSWEMLTAIHSNFEHLDRDVILGVVRKSVEAERMPEEALRQEMPDLLSSLQLLNDGNLRNAAIALFGTKFLPDYPQCQLKLARFQGINKDEFIDSNIIYGNLFSLLDQGMMFIRRHLPVAARIEPGKLERVETPIIPFDAIREAFINALCHRNYESRSGSVSLAIFDDRMEISNEGGLPRGVTIEKIKTGFSKPTNPLIAEVLYRCNLIEKWGRGVPMIIKSCKAAYDPEPVFYSDHLEFKIIFTFPMPLKTTVAIQKESFQPTQRQQQILRIMSGFTELNIRELYDKLEGTIPERTLRRDLADLKKLNILNSRGRGRAIVWYLV